MTTFRCGKCGYLESLASDLTRTFGYGKGAFVAQNADGDRLTGYYYDEKEPLLALMMWLPTALAIPLSQLPVLSQYLLGDPSAPTASPP